MCEEQLRRNETIQMMLQEGEWLTASEINALQASPPANKSLPAADWKLQRRIFGATFGSQEYFAKYQFDAQHQPLPIIKEILAALGYDAEAWAIAAWFHFPSAWLCREGPTDTVNVAPKDVLDALNETGSDNTGAELVAAAAKHLSSYVA